MKSIWTKIVPMLLIVCLVLSLAACGDKAEAPKEETKTETESTTTPETETETEAAGPLTAADTVVPGSKLVYAVSNDITTYVPWNGSGSIDVLLSVYDSLLCKWHGDPNDVRGNLAESWTVSEDGCTWVFKLREDAKFSSGNPVNAEAVIVSWTECQEYQPRFFTTVESYEATGEYEVTVKLTQNTPTFIYELPMQANCGILDPEYLTKYGTEDNNSAVGAGPYMIEEYVPGEYVMLIANPYYNREGRLPQVERIEYRFILDSNTMLLAFLNGEIDIMKTGSTEAVKTLQGAGFEPLAMEDRHGPYWMNASQVECFQDRRVREAICHMIDWEAINTLVYDGLYETVDSYFLEPSYSPYNEKHTYDPELGLKLIEEAGYKPEDIEFEIVMSTATQNEVLAIQEQFRQLGLVNVTAQMYDGGVAYSNFKAGTYDVHPMHNGFSAETPMSPFKMGMIPERNQPAIFLDYMDGGERYDEAMELYNKGMACTTFEEHAEYARQLVALIQDECVAFCGLGKTTWYALSENVHNLVLQPVLLYPEFCYCTVE